MGIGAVIYTDLSNTRIKDIDFPAETDPLRLRLGARR